jgi:hypothetical protein
LNEGSFAELRLEHDRDPVAVVNKVAAGIADARARGVRKLLVDLRATDIPAPSLAQRDALVTMWARAAAGQVVLAVLAPSRLLDAERFGTLVAAAAGMRAEGFEDEVQARAWLERQRDPVASVPPAPFAADDASVPRK